LLKNSSRLDFDPGNCPVYPEPVEGQGRRILALAQAFAMPAINAFQTAQGRVSDVFFRDAP
jgi:hypothetical protein